MTVGELTKYLEDWAPPGIAWERDNVGLQVGSRKQRIKSIMLCLDINSEVLKESIKKNCNLIISHHPFIFNPLKTIDTTSSSQSQIIQKALKKDISIYSAHTNLDFTSDGVSITLAKKLKLDKINYLKPISGYQLKLTVFVPVEFADPLSKVLFKNGAGIIGNYSECSFRTEGTGTFKGSAESKPIIGKKEVFEKVKEVKIEFVVNAWNLNSVVHALKLNHPYETPAFDIYPLKNENINYGFGAIGELQKEMSETEFLKHVTGKLKCSAIRFASGKGKIIKSVAVCGGSGTELIDSAIQSGADAFVTADIKYHQFQDAENKILLIDAGHFETEIPVIETLQKKIKEVTKDKNINVFKYSGSTNPVKFFKH